MAVAIGRPIEPDEDVHHKECRNVRCVEPAHLVVIPAADHRAHHAAKRRREVCLRHNRPYDRRDPRTGWPICFVCRREANARWRRKL